MDLQAIFAFLDALPVWVWLIAGVAVLFVLGDRGLWDYEAKFPGQAGVGRGEVEFECYKRRGSVIEARFELDPVCQGHEIDIHLEGTRVWRIPADRTNQRRVTLNEQIDLEEPREGARVEVFIGGMKRFSGPLVRD